MDIMQCIKTRRTIRKFKDEFVPWDKLVVVVEAARYAPSAGNLQNWKIVLIKEDAIKAKIARACVEQHWIAQAAFLLIVVGEPKSAERFFGSRSTFYTIATCGAVVQNMLLAAHNEGLGAAWIGAFDEEMIRDVINHAEYNHVQAVIALGIPDENPQAPLRNRLETMLYFERWFSRRRFAPYGWQSLNTPGAVRNTRKYIEKLTNRIKEKTDKIAGKWGMKPKEEGHEEAAHPQRPASPADPSHPEQPHQSPSQQRIPRNQVSVADEEPENFPPLEPEWYGPPELKPAENHKHKAPHRNQNSGDHH